jgi:hypothetical protein
MVLYNAIHYTQHSWTYYRDCLFQQWLQEWPHKVISFYSKGHNMLTMTSIVILKFFSCTILVTTTAKSFFSQNFNVAKNHWYCFHYTWGFVALPLKNFMWFECEILGFFKEIFQVLHYWSFDSSPLSMKRILALSYLQI